MSEPVTPFYNQTGPRWLSRPIEGYVSKEDFWLERPANISMAEWAFCPENKHRLPRAARYIFQTIHRMTASRPDTFFSIEWMCRKLGQCIACASGAATAREGEYIEPFEKTTWRDRAGLSSKYVHGLIRRMESIGLILVRHDQYANRYRVAADLTGKNGAAVAESKTPATPTRRYATIEEKPKAKPAKPSRKDVARQRVTVERLFPRVRQAWESLQAAQDAFSQRLGEIGGIAGMDGDELIWTLEEQREAAQFAFQREFHLHYGDSAVFEPPDG
jgi:DNA-binding MarR family transcriptional regulator